MHFIVNLILLLIFYNQVHSQMAYSSKCDLEHEFFEIYFNGIRIHFKGYYSHGGNERTLFLKINRMKKKPHLCVIDYQL